MAATMTMAGTTVRMTRERFSFSQSRPVVVA
jgi:hypothetical protein